MVDQTRIEIIDQMLTELEGKGLEPDALVYQHVIHFFVESEIPSEIPEYLLKAKELFNNHFSMNWVQGGLDCHQFSHGAAAVGHSLS